MQRLLLIVLLALSLSIPPPVEAAPSPLCPARFLAMALLGRPSADGALLAGSPAGRPVARAQPLRYLVQPGDTLSGLAARFRTTVAALMAENGLDDPDTLVAGQALSIPAAGDAGLPPPFEAVWRAGPAVQGRALLVWVEVAPGTELRGQLDGQTIEFHYRCGLWWGLVAFDAMLEPGPRPIELTAVTRDGRSATVSVPVEIEPGGYETETIWLDPDTEQLLDPALIRAENQRVNALLAELAGPPLWSGRFQRPIDTPVTSLFGTRRSWNGRPATTYHEGIDFDGEVGDEIRAAAAGRVVMAERLTVRGNAVFLDHGAGVVTGYFHMSELAVEAGQAVQPGDLLGKVGATGLVTGPHVHWELRVNGRWVDPGPWLEVAYP